MEKYKHTFAGCSSNGNRKFEDEFDTLYDNDNDFVAISKNEYTCGLSNKTVYFRIALRIENARNFSDDNDIYAELFLVPSYRSLHKKQKEDSYSFTGVSETMEEWGKSLFYFLDLVFEGKCIQLAFEKKEYFNDDEYDKIFENIKVSVANTYSTYAGLIGFSLDRYANRIGYTGWDYLRMWCNNLSTKTLIKEIKKRHNL